MKSCIVVQLPASRPPSPSATSTLRPIRLQKTGRPTSGTSTRSGRRAGPARTAERSAAVAAGVAIDVEAVEEVVEGESPHLALGDDPAGQPDVEPQEEECADGAEDEQADLRAHFGPEDAGVADALEPDGVRPQADAHRQEEAEENQDGNNGDSQDHPAAADVDLGQIAARADRSRPARTSVSATTEDPLIVVAPISAIAGIGPVRIHRCVLP